MVAALISHDLRFTYFAPHDRLAQLISDPRVEGVLARCTVAMPLVTALETLRRSTDSTGQFLVIHASGLQLCITAGPNAKPCEQVNLLINKPIKFVQKILLSEQLQKSCYFFLFHLRIGAIRIGTANVAQLIRDDVAFEMFENAFVTKLVSTAPEEISGW